MRSLGTPRLVSGVPVRPATPAFVVRHVTTVWVCSAPMRDERPRQSIAFFHNLRGAVMEPPNSEKIDLKGHL